MACAVLGSAKVLANLSRPSCWATLCWWLEVQGRISTRWSGGMSEEFRPQSSLLVDPMTTEGPAVSARPNTSNKALPARSIGSLSGYLASRIVKITFSPLSMANSGNSRCSPAIQGVSSQHRVHKRPSGLLRERRHGNHFRQTPRFPSFQISPICPSAPLKRLKPPV